MDKVEMNIVKKLNIEYVMDNIWLSEMIRRALFRIESVTNSIDSIRTYVIYKDRIIAADIFKTNGSNSIKRLRRYRNKYNKKGDKIE